MYSCELKFLIGIMRPYTGRIVLLLVCLLFASIFDGISVGLTVPLLASLQVMESSENLPAVLGWLFDLLKSFPEHIRILTGIAAVIVALTLKNIMLAYTFRLASWVSTRISAVLSINSVKILLKIGIDYHHKNRVGELMVTALSAPQEVGLLVSSMVLGVSNLVTTIVFVVLMLILSWQLFLISALFGILYFLITSRYLKTLEEPSTALTRLDLTAHSTLQESLNGIELVKSYGREPYVLGRLGRLIEQGRDIRFSNMFRSNVVAWVTDVAGGLVIALLFVIGMLVYDLNAPDLLAIMIPFLYIVVRLVPIFGTMNQQRADVIVRWPKLRLLSDLFSLTDRHFIKDGDIAFPGLNREIRFKNVSFAYGDSALPAVDSINLTIPKGKVTAIVGQSGAGKTTLVNLLLRYHDPQQGEILLDELPLSHILQRTYQSRISVVSQETVIFNDTVRNNIALGMDTLQDDALVEVTKKAGAYEFICELEKGFDTMLGERGVRLSGGQRQRISIARAFLKDPGILILDEATSSLDSVSENEIYQHIESLKSNRTVIVISHRLSTIENADRIIVIKEGRIVEQGQARDLVAMGGEYYELSRRQETTQSSA